jgi:hypothetical protein
LQFSKDFKVHLKVFYPLNNDWQTIALYRNKDLRLLDSKKKQDLEQEL